MGRGKELATCPYCDATVRSDRLETHKTKRCAQNPAAAPYRESKQRKRQRKQERAERLSMRPIAKPAPISKLIEPPPPVVPLPGRCRFCGGPPLVGLDFCYACGVQ